MAGDGCGQRVADGGSGRWVRVAVGPLAVGGWSFLVVSCWLLVVVSSSLLVCCYCLLLVLIVLVVGLFWLLVNVDIVGCFVLVVVGC